MLKLSRRTEVRVPVQTEEGVEEIVVTMQSRTAEQERQIRLARAGNAYVQRMLEHHRKLKGKSAEQVMRDIESNPEKLEEMVRDQEALAMDRSVTQDMLDLADQYIDVLVEQIVSWAGVADQNGEPVPWPEDRKERALLLRHEGLYPDFALGATGLYDVERSKRVGKSKTAPADTSGT